MSKAYKKYKSNSDVEYNFYVRVNDKEEFISFNRPGATLIIEDMKLARAIEESQAFKKKKIALVNTVGKIEEEDKTDVDTEVKEYPDVKTVGDAQEVLMSEYGVPEEDIPLKKDVLAKAKELGVKFPNYR